LIWLWRVWNI